MLDTETSMPLADLRPSAKLHSASRRSKANPAASSPTIEGFADESLLAKLSRDRSTSDPFALARRPGHEQLRALVYLLAICERMNWDVLLSQVAARLAERTDCFEAARVATLRKSDMTWAFDGYTRDDGSLRLGKRLGALKAVAEAEWESQIADRIEHAPRLAGPGGVYEILEGAEPYRADPLRKKANVLVHELLRRDLIRVADERRVRPAVDYHIIRVMLRTGRVWIADAELRRKLRAREPVPLSTITQIRKAVSDAVISEAHRLGMPIPEANEILWAFGRRQCRRDTTACSTGVCPLANVCSSYGELPIEMLTEPDSRHGFY